MIYLVAEFSHGTFFGGKQTLLAFSPIHLPSADGQMRPPH